MLGDAGKGQPDPVRQRWPVVEHYFGAAAGQGYWFSLIVLQAFDFKLDRRDEPHLNSQYLPPGKTFFQNT